MSEYVAKGIHEGRCQVEDERFRRDKERLDKLDTLTQTLSDTNIKMGQILVQLTKDVGEHEERLSAVEQKPAKRWDGLISTLIAAVIAGVVGYAMACVGLAG